MVFFVLLGGALGSAARYGTTMLVHNLLPTGFPWGTLTVNMAGGLVIGFLYGLFEHVGVPAQVRIFLFVGVLGGFTTFSSLTLETMELVHAHHLGRAAVNILVSNALGMAVVFLGYLAARGAVAFAR